ATVLSGQLGPPVPTPSRPGLACSAVKVMPSWYGPGPSTENSMSPPGEARVLARGEPVTVGWPVGLAAVAAEVDGAETGVLPWLHPVIPASTTATTEPRISR